MKKFEGKEIREVWDFRLSTANPLIDTRSGTWIVHIYSNKNPDFTGKAAQPLESYDTGIKSEVGDEYDSSKVSKCYEWLYSVRDKYSRKNIEELKPHVKKINAANKALAELGAI